MFVVELCEHLDVWLNALFTQGLPHVTVFCCVECNLEVDWLRPRVSGATGRLSV